MKETADGDFTTVSRRKTARKNKSQKRAVADNLSVVPDSISDDRLDALVDDARRELRKSESFVSDVLSLVTSQVRPNQTAVVCYGLGNFSQSEVSRYQLALLLEILERLLPHVLCAIFDPQFTVAEKHWLERHRYLFQLLPNNDAACCSSLQHLVSIGDNSEPHSLPDLVTDPSSNQSSASELNCNNDQSSKQSFELELNGGDDPVANSSLEPELNSNDDPCSNQNFQPELNCSNDPASNQSGTNRPNLTSERMIFAYMPHCGRAMYNNLLWANWSPQALERLVVFGNDFTTIPDDHGGRTELDYLRRARALCASGLCQKFERCFNAFNDCAVMHFTVSSAQLCDMNLWKRSDTVPIYRIHANEIVLDASE